MVYEDLARLLCATTEPVELPSALHLREAEEELGLALPDDYKWFIGVYGTGGVGDFIRVLNPIAKRLMLNLLYAAQNDDFDAYWSGRDLYPERYTYPRYPENEGLLPCADTSNGDVIYWLTKGKPDNWTLVFYDRSFDKFYNIQFRFCEFLVGVITTQQFNYMFPDDIRFEDGKFAVYHSEPDGKR